ncbi:MAG: hypothetical protein MUP40_05080 [Actinobacteria bacterium]|nr:hypothetical protein [Actinomycetota bacterium]
MRNRLNRQRYSSKVLAVFVAAFLSATVLAGGCGSLQGDVNDYLKITRPILDNVTSRLSELRNYLAQPLAGQEGIEESLANFRKALADGQKKIDKKNEPAPCSELARLLRLSLDQGRETADMITPFADNLGNLAPLAKQSSDIVSVLSKMNSDEEIAAAMASYQSRGERLASGLQSVFVSPTFQSVREELASFIETMNKQLADAQSVAERTLEQQPPEEQSGQTSSAQQNKQKEVKRKSGPLMRIVAEIADDWGRTDGKMTAMVDILLKASGLRSKQAEFDGTVTQILGQIQNLEQQYKVQSGK